MDFKTQVAQQLGLLFLANLEQAAVIKDLQEKLAAATPAPQAPPAP
jgi:hypothetical protein